MGKLVTAYPVQSALSNTSERLSIPYSMGAGSDKSHHAQHGRPVPHGPAGVERLVRGPC